MKLKLIIVLILIILFPLLGAGGYYYYNLQKNKPPAPKSQEENSDQESRGSQITILAEGRVISPILSFGSEHIWYMTEDGKMYRQSLESTTREEYLLPEGLGSPSQVVWPISSSDFIVEYVQDGHVRYQHYSASQQKFTPYAPNIRAVRFINNDAKIVYDWITGAGLHELKISDPDGTNFQKVADLFQPDYQIVPSPVNNEVVVFAPRESGEGSRLMRVDLATGKFSEVDIKPDLYNGAKFSPDGQKLLATAHDEQGGRVYLYDLRTGDKFELPGGLGIDRVAWNRAGTGIYFVDAEAVSIYELETRRERSIFSFEPTQKYNPRSVFVHPDDRQMFFVNESDGKLYRVELE